MLELDCSFQQLEGEIGKIISSLDRKLFLNSRWFQAKDAVIDKIKIRDRIVLLREKDSILVSLILNFVFTDRDNEIYYLPLIISDEKRENYWLQLSLFSGMYYVSEAVHKPCYHKCLLNYFYEEKTVETAAGGIFFALKFQPAMEPVVQPLTEDTSNSLSLLTEYRVMKTYRRLQKGVNPELEIPLALQEKTNFKNFPHIYGCFVYQDQDSSQYSLSLLVEYISGGNSGWNYAREFLESYVNKRGLSSGTGFAVYKDGITRLGELVADMHSSLATVFGSREPQEEELENWLNGIRENFQELVAGIEEENNQLQQLESKVYQVLARILRDVNFSKCRFTRIHGDLHLEQVLWTGDDFYILDFEGEPLRELESRRQWYPPLKDVAGMLRSFAYTADIYLRRQENVASGGVENWLQVVEEIFLSAYFTELKKEVPDLLPPEEIREKVLALCCLEKAIYEGLYELKNRPGLLQIPLTGIEEWAEKFL